MNNHGDILKSCLFDTKVKYSISKMKKKKKGIRGWTTI